MLSDPARIFVQIAAYRDPELVPTLRDCLARASYPDRLRFGLVWQHAEGETLAEFADDPRVRLIAIPYERSRGACWARQQTQRLYADEPYTLQIDSHHRFVEGWDDALVDMLQSLQDAGHARPLLTSYAPVYQPDEDPRERGSAPLRLRFDGFTQDGPFAVMPETIDDFEAMTAPEPARFFSAHFAFTLGRFCRDVPYDPKLYFFGEEPAMAIRAYTHGYDLFHPHRTVIWHHYGRSAAPKHWGDHQRWMFRNTLSMRRFQQLVGRHMPAADEPDLGEFGLGGQRTLAEYQCYAGICFSTRSATAYAHAARPPPEPEAITTLQALAGRLVRQHPLRIPIAEALQGLTLDDVAFVYVGAHDRAGGELTRFDLAGSALQDALSRGYVLLDVESPMPPASWTLWIYRRVGGWGERVDRQL